MRRNKLTGLKNLFYALVRAQNTRPKDRAAPAGARRTRGSTEEGSPIAQRATEEVKRFVRIIHVLEVENDNLKTTSGARGGTVQVLPQRSAPPPPQR